MGQMGCSHGEYGVAIEDYNADWVAETAGDIGREVVETGTAPVVAASQGLADEGERSTREPGAQQETVSGVVGSGRGIFFLGMIFVICLTCRMII